MALKQVIMARRIADARAKFDALVAKSTDFDAREAALKTREAQLEQAVNEVTGETSDEDCKAVDDAVEALEADQMALDGDVAANDAAKAELEAEIKKLSDELDGINKKSAAPPTQAPKTNKEEHRSMKTRGKLFGMDYNERAAFFAREEVKGFIDNLRSVNTRGVTNASVLIPEVMLEVLRDNMAQYSKLIQYVTVRTVRGKARQNILGAVPEGVWMEATGALNELEVSFNQVEVDGFKVGGIVYVPNSTLADSDVNLGSEIMAQLGQAIGKALDRAILYGTGTKMPIGIATRLAQTSAPSTWGTYAPTWTDLHATNVVKLNINGTTGATFYASLIASLGLAKPNYTDGRAFWVMNRTTHINLMAKALAFDAAAALLAGVNNQMPILGGDIVEIEGMTGDNEIIGGYAGAYLLVEREGSAIESSEHYKFAEDQTAVRAYARYDGMPLFGEAFVAVSFDNTDAATTSTFGTDYANTDLGVLGVTAAAGSGAGKTVLTVTGTEDSGTTLKYKVGDIKVKTGDKATGFTAMTSGTTNIVAASGTLITVVELDGSSRVIKSGKAAAVNP